MLSARTPVCDRALSTLTLIRNLCAEHLLSVPMSTMDEILCICSCGCGNEVDERTDRRHRNGKGPLRIAAQHLSDTQFLDGSSKRPFEALGDVENGRPRTKHHRMAPVGTDFGTLLRISMSTLEG